VYFKGNTTNSLNKRKIYCKNQFTINVFQILQKLKLSRIGFNLLEKNTLKWSSSAQFMPTLMQRYYIIIPITSYSICIWKNTSLCRFIGIGLKRSFMKMTVNFFNLDLEAFAWVSGMLEMKILETTHAELTTIWEKLGLTYPFPVSDFIHPTVFFII